MKGLTWYYISRAAIAAVAAVIAWLSTHSIWLSVGTWLVVMAGFVWYARSGHFTVDPSRPLTPLRRDEREQSITYRAATYAFVVMVLLLAVLGFLGFPTQVWLSIAILTGFVVYFVARAWLRHVM